jgi:polysaccharide deacetylase family protein (PEP-CTERM system associated)
MSSDAQPLTSAFATLPARRAGDGRIINAMSVDVEEFFQVGAFEATIKRSSWANIESRVAHNTDIVLDLFARKNVKATFFTLGWVAERQPALIRRLVSEGHELASHGYEHDRIHTLTPQQFADDLVKTKKILEDIGGVEVIGYRAPSFSIGERNRWALDTLAMQGYRYSSSVYPIAHDHYGWPSAPRQAFLPVPGSSLIEIPVTTVRALGKIWPCGGGGFFRLLPYSLSRWTISQVNAQDGQPAIFYFHPWEVDPGQPVQHDAPIKSRLRHYVNLDKMLGKIARVLDDFAWDRVDRVFLASDAAAHKRAA